MGYGDCGSDGGWHGHERLELTVVLFLAALFGIWLWVHPGWLRAGAVCQ